MSVLFQSACQAHLHLSSVSSLTAASSLHITLCPSRPSASPHSSLRHCYRHIPCQGVLGVSARFMFPWQLLCNVVFLLSLFCGFYLSFWCPSLFLGPLLLWLTKKKKENSYTFFILNCALSNVRLAPSAWKIISCLGKFWLRCFETSSKSNKLIAEIVDQENLHQPRI